MDQNQRRARNINMRKGKPLPHIRTAPVPNTVLTDLDAIDAATDDPAIHAATARIRAALDGPADATPPADFARLRAWLVTEAATSRRNAVAARYEEARQALDGMAAGHDVTVRVIDGLVAGEGLPVSGGSVAGDATLAGESDADRG